MLSWSAVSTNNGRSRHGLHKFRKRSKKRRALSRPEVWEICSAWLEYTHQK